MPQQRKKMPYLPFLFGWIIAHSIGCASSQNAEPPTSKAAADPSASSSSPSAANDLTSPQEVAQALDNAQAAFLEGQWDVAVVGATRVIEGAASPDEYYMAVKILGLASCNRKDPRPVTFAWSRLQAADRESLRNECIQHGLQIDDQGVVTSVQPVQ